MKGTRFLDGHSQVDEHRGCLGLKGRSEVSLVNPSVMSFPVSSEL